MKQDAGFAEEARQRDAADPLRGFRDHFYLPPGRLYFDGNSLGPLSREAEQSLQRAIEAWREWAVEGWTEAESPWFGWAERLSARVAPLIGASPDCVAVTGSTTGNLHQLLATLYDPTDSRPGILADDLNFPSDLFALESHLRLRGRDPRESLVKVASRDGRTLDEDDIARALRDSPVQIAVFSSVLFASGQLLDMAFVTREARRNDVIIGWDLSHSVGAVPHALDEWDADFAFWCHYKYLNAGPGAIGGLYRNRRYADKIPGLAGWWGSRKERQFEMTHAFHPAETAGALQIGTPFILSLAPLDGALSVHEAAGMDRLRAKSLALTDFLRRLVEAELTQLGFSVVTPREAHRRGGHLAVAHPQAARLSRELRRSGVVPDFRPPDLLRLAPAALYTTFADCVEVVERLRGAAERLGQEPAGERSLVP